MSDEPKDIKDLPPEQKLWVVPIKRIEEKDRIGLYRVLSVDPENQKIGLLDKAFIVKSIRPDGKIVLKPAKDH